MHAVRSIQRMCWWILPLVAATSGLASDALEPGGTVLTVTIDPARVDQPLAQVPPPLLAPAMPSARGRELFERDWLAPRGDGGTVLAGPHYDRGACTACHIEALASTTVATAQSYLVARPVDAAGRRYLGAQANTRHAGGKTPEAIVSIRYEYRQHTYPDGRRRRLRKPLATARTARGDSLPVALRAAPLLFGWGLLEHVDQQMLRPFHDPVDRNGDGISGRAAVTDDPCTGRMAMGVFGWKGTHSTLANQISAALRHDMGITNPTPCADDSAPPGELTAADLSAITEFVRRLAVPAHRRNGDRQRTDDGERLFGLIGCADCHVPVLLTRHEGPAELADQRAWAYTDLMLHDLGAALADPGDGATASEWRTAPLWGVGLVEARYPQRGFLHDGRATTLEDAILWHGGEALRARQRFSSLRASEREILLAFVRAL